LSTGNIIPFPLERRTSSPSRHRAYTLRVHLVSGPSGREQEGREIFRALKLRGDQTLEDLHYAIQGSFDREQEGGGYAFSFAHGSFGGPESLKYRGTEALKSGSPPEPDAGGTPLSGFATLDSLHLEPETLLRYRSGTADLWGHLIRVVRVGPVNPSEEYPLLVEKTGRPPGSRGGGVPAAGGGGWAAEDPGGVYRGEMLSLLLRETDPSVRGQWERVNLRPNTRLRTAVRGLPSHWLDGICMLLGMNRMGSRQVCIEMLTKELPDQESLRRVWSCLPGSAREMVVWILREKGGWATVRQISLQFGRASEFGCWWSEERIPAGPLSILRLCGLVYVGGIPAGNKKKTKIATVPVELRRPLKEIAETPETRQKTASSLWKLFLEGASSPGPAPPPPRRVLASREPGKGRWKELCELGIRGFMRDCPLEKDTERFYTYMIARIRREPDRFPREEVRLLLREMIRGSSAWNRLAAYKLGAVLFGKRFAGPAKKDASRRIRQWARDLFDPRQEELF